MPLESYHRKRNFTRSPEPAGHTGAPSAGENGRFVVQKHAARRLHYDFRLELDGVLKSWAVTRGPSLVPGDKRLAVEVEDHPLDYADFEGTIPKGEYGGGRVIVWDRGRWQPQSEAHAGLAKGHLDFILDGEKLRGRWHLVRMPDRPGAGRHDWLLIKGDDAFARTPDEPDILTEAPASVLTGRDIAELADAAAGGASRTGRLRAAPVQPARPKRATAPAPARTERITGDPPPAPLDPSVVKGARKAPPPDVIPPVLATLVAKPPSGSRYVHEIKFDGYRIAARLADGKVRLLTRSGLDWTERFGSALTQALAGLPAASAYLDGEVVVEAAGGASDFSQLQADLSEGRTDRFVYYAFDLPYLDGYDLTAAPLLARKALLQELLAGAPAPLRYSAHFEDDGSLVLTHACRLGLEGVVSKDGTSTYRSGRGQAWVKSKCTARQEFVIGGFTRSTTSPDAIGALLLGVYENGALVPVGRVGTGFSAATAHALCRRLEAIRIGSSPFSRPLTAAETRGALFVKPGLVAEVEFRAFTADGQLRHAAFRGLREDKPAREIVREGAKPGDPPPPPQKRRVTLTHPDRLYWPEAGITKERLADYYAAVWRHAAPFLTGRPLALVRCPEGIGGPRFFQKHAWKGIGAAVLQITDPKAPGDAPLIAIRDLDGLMALVQGACLEIHPWGARAADVEHPDMLVMDLDPGPGVPWTQVIAAAREVRGRLEAAGLAAFVKTSGGKGLHVVAPLVPRAGWRAAKAFTRAMAEAMAADSPRGFTASIAKARRDGRILVDYLRNQRGATAVAPWSSRAWAGAPVSMPLRWDELVQVAGAGVFTIANTPDRLAALGTDPWAGFTAAAAPLEGAD